MTAPRTSTSHTAPAPRRGLCTAHTVVSGLLVATVFVQAALAGRFFFSGAEIALHGYLGNGSFTLGLIAVGLALAGRMPPWLLAVTGMTALLMFVQTGLGYLGRDELEAAAWHVPLGVLIFGLAMWQFTASVQVSRRSRS